MTFWNNWTVSFIGKWLWDPRGMLSIAKQRSCFFWCILEIFHYSLQNGIPSVNWRKGKEVGGISSRGWLYFYMLMTVWHWWEFWLLSVYMPKICALTSCDQKGQISHLLMAVALFSTTYNHAILSSSQLVIILMNRITDLFALSLRS